MPRSIRLSSVPDESATEPPSKAKRARATSDNKPSQGAANPSVTQLQEALRLRLCALPYPAYTRLVRALLVDSGYASVRGMKSALAPHAPQPGGFDLVAFSHTDLSTHLTAIQIKQSGHPVGRRYVDELRGAMLRLGAEQGMLIATGEFSKAAREAAVLPVFLPVRLIDGLDLAARFLEQGEGVCIKRLPQRPGEAVEWEVDEAFFARLEAAVPDSQSHPRTQGR